MNLKDGSTFAGGLVGAVVAVGMFIPMYIYDLAWLTILIAFAVVIIGYIIAAVSAPSITATEAGGGSEFMRGLLVGLNAGMNGCLSFAVWTASTALAGGIVVGAVLGLVNFLVVFSAISKSGFYQGLVGWLCWAMPMSWFVIGLGLFFLWFSLALALFTAGKVDYLSIKGFRVDWKTCTLFIKGGLIANLNPLNTAFNMGNISFVDNASTDTTWHIEHEAGHTLNLTAFGSMFHFMGALEENAFGRGGLAYSERLADSNDPASGATGNIPMWA